MSAAQMSNPTSQKTSVVITEGETWPGFYAAYCAIKTNKFSRVVVAVKDKSIDLVHQLQELGCEIQVVDPCQGDSSELNNLFKNVESLLLIPVHASGKSGNEKCSQVMIKATRNLLQAAEKSGSIKRVMLWSSLGAGLISGGGSEANGYKEIFTGFQEVERLVKSSKINHEVTVRKGFCDQMLFAFSNVIQSRGMLPLTTSTGKMAPLNIKDLGQASATMLANPNEFAKWHRQTLQITGTQSLNGPTLAQMIGRSLNAKVEFQEVKIDEMKEILQKSAGDQMNLTECMIMLAYMELLRDQKLDVVTNELKDILGREPSDISSFFKENPDSFRPSGSKQTMGSIGSKQYLSDLKHAQTAN